MSLSVCESQFSSLCQLIIFFVDKKAKELLEKQGSVPEAVVKKKTQIETAWEDLKKRSADRQKHLEDAYKLHKFLSDYKDLISWIEVIKTIINADDLAKDVAGAEILLERHQEHKGEIDAREDSFITTELEGKSLIEQGISVAEVM